MPPRLDRNKGERKKNRKRAKGRGRSPTAGESVDGQGCADVERDGKRKEESIAPQEADAAYHRESSYFPPRNPTTSVDTSHYKGAHSFSIGQQNITTTNINASKTLFDYLNPHVAHAAAHDSNDRRDSPPCHEETRVAIREDIVGWMKHGEDEDDPKQIMWLSGPAGSGKSAIAGSVAETCQEERILAASFFFSSFSPSIERRWSCGLIATLVYQMSQHRALRPFRDRLLLVLEDFPHIFHKRLKEQAQQLILEPFRQLHGQVDQAGWPKAVIIDGLDEIVAPQDPSLTLQRAQRTPEDDQAEVLGVLLALCRSPYFPFRIFVASRPEQHIVDFFADAEISTVPLFLDSKYNPDADIKRFLLSKFAQIRRRSGIVDPSWPGESALVRIVDMSSGQFIVPTTVIRWVETGIPQQQLDDVLGLRPDEVTSKNPFAPLDALYSHILTRAHCPDGDPCLVVKWILSISFAQSASLAVDELPASFWRELFEETDGEFNYRMMPILSLVNIPPPLDTVSPIKFYHKSLVDYLLSERRCGILYVDETKLNSYVSDRIAEALRRLSATLTIEGTQDLLGKMIHLDETIDPNGRISEQLETRYFLRCLGPKGLKALASCDVVRWTKSCLHSTSEYLVDAALLCFVCGIYFGIHDALRCGLVQPGCHAACTHWRAGILAGAKELDFCTCVWEEIPVDELGSMLNYECCEVDPDWGLSKRLCFGCGREELPRWQADVDGVRGGHIHTPKQASWFSRLGDLY